MDFKGYIAGYNKIIVYGAGAVGRTVMEKFVYENSQLPIYAVAVTEKDGNPDKILNVPVVCIDNLLDVAAECVVLIATLEEKQTKIAKNLTALGFHNICYMRDEVYRKWKKDNRVFYRRYTVPYLETVKSLCEEPKDIYIQKALESQSRHDIVNIARLVVVLGTKCSLRCRDCNNLIPYFKPQKDLDEETILKVLEILLCKVHTILVCELIGGEPFLSNNLDKVIRLLVVKQNVYQIEITTNGTVLPNTELIPLLQNPKIKVRVSDYGKMVNKREIIEFLEKNNIHYQMLEIENWVSPGGVEKRCKSEEQLKEDYNRCYAGYYCKTLYEGKIFACARAASLYALGYMKEQEFIEMSERTTVDEIKRFLGKSYSIACDYCDMACMDKKRIEPARQLE